MIAQLEKLEKILQEKQTLKQRIMRKILENPEDEADLKAILDEVKNEAMVLERNYNEMQERLEYLNKTEEGFEVILEVEKLYKNKIENLTEKQWMDLVHKFVDTIYINEDNIKVVMRVGRAE